jgi:predicted DNA binding CopG/RHH family protein
LSEGKIPSELPFLAFPIFYHFATLIDKKIPMRKKIITQTRSDVKKVLNKKQEKKALRKIKHARYMREEYSKRKKRFNLTFDLDQFQKIQKEAQAVGITPTAFLRESALAYMEKERIPTQEVEEKFRELIFLLRNMSGNLNQIARQANTVQKLSLNNFIQTKHLINHLEDTAKDFIKRF